MPEFDFSFLKQKNQDKPQNTVDTKKEFDFSFLKSPNKDITENFENTVDIDSDRQNEVEKIARDIGQDVEYVDTNFEQIKKLKDIPTDKELDEIKQQSPNTYDLMKNKNDVAIIKDDYKNLSKLEAALQKLKQTTLDRATPFANIKEIAGQSQQVVQETPKAIEHFSIQQKQAELLQQLRNLWEKEGKRVNDENLENQIKQLSELLEKNEYENKEGFQVTDFTVPATDFALQLLKGGVKAILGAGAGAVAGGAIGAGVGSFTTAGAVATALKGAKTGAKLGALTGMYQYSYFQEANFAFMEYKDYKDKDGNYYDYQKVLNASMIAGHINAVLETAGDLIGYKMLKPVGKFAGNKLGNVVGKFADNPQAKKIVEMVLKDPKYENMPFPQAVRQATFDLVVDPLAETTIEGLQNLTTNVAGNIIKDNSYNQEQLQKLFKDKYKISDIEGNWDKLSEEDKLLWQNRRVSFADMFVDSLAGLGDVWRGSLLLSLIGGSAGVGGGKFSQKRLENRVNDIVQKAQKIEQADMVANNLKAVGEIAKQVKTVTRNPQKAEEFVEKTVGKDTQVFVSANALNEVLNQENEIKQNVLQQLGISNQEQNISADTNSNIKISLAKWMIVAQNIKLSNGTTLFDSMLNDTKLDETGYTLKEKQDAIDEINRMRTELEKDVEKQKQVLNTADKDTKQKLETFFNMILDEAQPETMNDKKWKKDKEYTVRLWTAQALVSMQKRNINFEQWYEQNKNLRFVNELSDSRNNIKNSAIQAVQDIVDYQIDNQQAQQKYDLQQDLIKQGQEVKEKITKPNFLNFYSMPTEQFVAQYEKLTNTKLNLDKKGKIQFHKDFVREAIRQGATIDEKILKELDINPEYVDKRKFESRNSNEEVFNQPMLSDVDVNEEVNVINLSGFKFNPNKSIKEQIEEKLNGIKEPLSDKSKKMLVDIVTKRRKDHIKNSSQFIRLQKDKKARKRHNKEVLNIDTLIQNSVLIEIAPNTKPNKKGKKNVESYYYFYVPVRFGNSIYTVKLFAEQKEGEKEINPNTVHLYDVIEIKKLGKLSRSYQLSHLPSTISITEMLSGVKDYKGNFYLFEEQKEQVRQQAIANGTFMKAPNGKQSNLSEDLWLTVRTPNFKNWFGDWENDPENASKVVDENGEPLVVYHGTTADFNIFKLSENGALGKGIYFAESKDFAKGVKPNAKAMPVFLNIKEPYEIQNAPLTEKEETKIKENKNDGVYHKANGFWVAFDNKQVKSVNNKGTFDTNNPDIYLQEDEIVETRVDLTDVFKELKELTQEQATQKIEEIINELIGVPLETGTKPLQIQLTKDNKKHIVNTNVKLSKGQDLRHKATLANLKEIIKNAVKIDKDGTVDLSHNTRPATIEHKKTIEKYVYFLGKAKAQTKDGVVYFNIEFTTEQIKKQDPNLLDLYHVRVKKQSQMPRLNDTLLNGSATNTITQDNIFVNKEKATNKIVRGFITGDEIHVTGASDISTYIHEMGHYWLRDLQNYVLSGQATEEVLKEWDTIKAWLNITDETKPLTREQQETYARGLETYMMEGKAPSIELRNIFRKVADLMKYIYKRLTFEKVELSQDVHDYFDRLFATEQEIAENLASMETDFNKFMQKQNEKLKQEYENVKQEAHQQAVEILVEETMKEKTEQYKQDIETKKQEFYTNAKKELEENTVYIATQKAVTDTKLSADELIKKHKENSFSQDEILALMNIVADNNMSSIDELIQNVEYFKEPQSLIEQNVNLLMQEYEDKINDPEFIKEKATEAVNNEKQIELLALEREILIHNFYKQDINKETAYTRSKQYRELVKEQATNYLESMPISKAKLYYKYVQAQERLNRQYATALQKGDIQQAIQLKEKIVLNSELIRQSLQLKKEFEKKSKNIEAFCSKKFYQNDNLVQVFNILNRVNLEHKQQKGYPIQSIPTLIEYQTAKNQYQNIDGQTATCEMLNLPEYLLDEQNAVSNLDDLTITQLRDVLTGLKQILHFDRLQQEMTVNGKKVEFETIVTELDKVARKNIDIKTQEKNSKEINKSLGDGYVKILGVNIPNSIETIKQFLIDSIVSTGIKLDTLIHKLDGKDSYGNNKDITFYNVFLEPAKRASDKENKMLKHIIEQYQNLIKLYNKKEWDNMINPAENTKIYVSELGNSFTKQELICMLLNFGNESSRQRLLETPVFDYKGDRENWNEQTLINVFQQYLDEKDYSFVQGVWSILEELGQTSFENHKELTGTYPQRVKEIPFTLYKDGKGFNFKGGYYPLKADPRFQQKVQDRNNALAEPIQQSFLKKPSTDKGYTMTRTKAKYPIQLSFSVFHQGVADQVHDVCFRKLIYDQNRLLSNPRLINTIKECLGKVGFEQFRNQVRVYGTRENFVGEREGFEKILNWFRMGVGSSMLAFKPGIIIQNLGNFFIYKNAIDNFGNVQVKKIWLKSLELNRHLVFNTQKGKAIKEFICSKSQMMTDRYDNFNYTMKECEQNMFEEKGRLAKLGNWLMVTSDNLSAVPAWIVAYEQGINELQLTDKQASDRADLLITRVVGSSRKMDQAQFTRSTNIVAKLFNPFASFMLNELNRWNTELNVFVKEKDFSRFAGFVVTRAFFAVISEILSGRLPDFDDDDDNLTSWFKFIVKDILGYGLSMIPYLRTFYNGIDDIVVGERGFIGTKGQSSVLSNINTGAVVPVNETIKTFRDIVTGNIKEGQMQAYIEKMIDGVLVDTHQPLIFNDWLFNAYDVFVNGMTPEFGDIFKRRPKNKRK